MRKLYLIPALILSILTGCGNSASDFSVDYLPVQTKKDAKWSFIGPDGKMLYEEEFENSPSPVVNGYFIVEENDGLSVYKADAKKPELVPGCEDLVSAGFMAEGLIPVTRKNERIKLVNTSGEEKVTLMPVDGKEIVMATNAITDGILIVKTDDGKCGVVSKSGKVLVTPQYDVLYYLGEDILAAYTFTKSDSDSKSRYDCRLLSKSGKEIANIKEEIQMCSKFVGGKALVKKGEDNIPGYIDTKGAFTKLPGKVHSFGQIFDGKVFSFGTEDGKTGLMNLDGEIIIRPKYEDLAAYGKNKYCADDGDKKWLILSETGEKEQVFDDFEIFIPLNQIIKSSKFEVIAAEKEHQFDFYKYDGKPVTQESFYDVRINYLDRMVETDYFNPEEIGRTLAGLVTDNGVKNLRLGEKIKNALPENADAKDYSGDYTIILSDISNGHGWELHARAISETPIASFSDIIDENGDISYGYVFNDADISSFCIRATSTRPFRDEAVNAIEEALTKRGFSKSGPDCSDEGLVAVMKKGDMEVRIVSFTELLENEDYVELTVGHPKDRVAPAEVEVVIDADSIVCDSIAR